MARLKQHKIGMSDSNWEKLKLEAELNGLKNNISQYIVKKLSLDDIDDFGKPVIRKNFDNRSSIKLSSELQRMFAANSNNLNQLTKSVNTLKNENVNDEFMKYVITTINNINETFEAIKDELISNPKESKILNSTESKISDKYTIINNTNSTNEILSNEIIQDHKVEEVKEIEIEEVISNSSEQIDASVIDELLDDIEIDIQADNMKRLERQKNEDEFFNTPKDEVLDMFDDEPKPKQERKLNLAALIEEHDKREKQ